MINEHFRIYTRLIICIYKFSAILKILKSARRSEPPLAVTSHLGASLVLLYITSTFFLALASERLGLGWALIIYVALSLHSIRHNYLHNYVVFSIYYKKIIILDEEKF
jgi:hypothetical protein